MSKNNGDLPTDLSSPARRALAAAGVTRLDDLTRRSEAELRRLHGMGPRALDQLREALAADGRSFAGDGPTPPAISVVVRPERPYVAIPARATLRQWGTVTPLVAEVFGWLGQRGVEPAGPPFFRYWVVGDAEREFDLEVGVPVARGVPCEGRVVSGTIPAGSYATLVHTGHPDRLVRSLAAMEEWRRRERVAWSMRRRGEAEVWGGRFESYLTDPAEQPDLERWSIELAYLLA
jgi:effector-binding domain-containing protein